ncbi:unnamed protein product [Linum trigynum]|uniref:25S rRNA (uridine-N(3))-methyltransferase BMT5-like domain-containing protein n=1 Tax=Linum trigynum TaxID=586398 RepID=A0AAV2E1B4_9ROSI
MADGDEMEQRRRVSTHYSSDQEIMLVGEGDFSFTVSLGLAFGSAYNIVATSLDTYDELKKKYKTAGWNLEVLRMLGAQVFHGVDATRMKLLPDLCMRKFDRIIFNFPHAGFHGKEDDPRLIREHVKLVHGFFRNASTMLRLDGEVHVTHKTSKPYSDWNIIGLASKSLLILHDQVDFEMKDYPRYNNKRGDGKRSDEPFRLGDCSTFKFRLDPSLATPQPRYQHYQDELTKLQYHQPTSTAHVLMSSVGGHDGGLFDPHLPAKAGRLIATDYIVPEAPRSLPCWPYSGGGTLTGGGGSLLDVEYQRKMKSRWRLMVYLHGQERGGY